MLTEGYCSAWRQLNLCRFLHFYSCSRRRLPFGGYRAPFKPRSSEHLSVGQLVKQSALSATVRASTLQKFFRGLGISFPTSVEGRIFKHVTQARGGVREIPVLALGRLRGEYGISRAIGAGGKIHSVTDSSLQSPLLTSLPLVRPFQNSGGGG